VPTCSRDGAGCRTPELGEGQLSLADQRLLELPLLQRVSKRCGHRSDPHNESIRPRASSWPRGPRQVQAGERFGHQVAVERDEGRQRPGGTGGAAFPPWAESPLRVNEWRGWPSSIVAAAETFQAAINPHFRFES